MTLEDYAELLLRIGLDLREGQYLSVYGEPEHAPFVRVLARKALELGARHVVPVYGDAGVKRAHVDLAADDELGWTPRLLLDHVRWESDVEAAIVSLLGDSDPRRFDGADPVRLGRTHLVELNRAFIDQDTARTTAWCVAACATPLWAQQLYGEPDEERLWGQIFSLVRLDEPDPYAAWGEHLARLDERRALLDERRFDAIRYRGPGTELEVGLLAQSRWTNPVRTTVYGARNVANMPSEEVWTAPDARRAEGTVRATRPLTIPQGGVVEGLEVEFRDGRAVRVSASSGEEQLRTRLATDEGAARLGEVSLVDGDSRVGRSGLVFYNLLIDENAACHLAFGSAYVDTVEGAEELGEDERAALGVNRSSVHLDFMVGADDVEVVGVEPGGAEVPLIVGGEWLLR